ncbi:MAG: hypothetical protein HY695_10465 [Deltaproteobacteria bacterium]|nr:hypothetical protein [Deltaproteobacteria bacterium]
MLGEEEIRQLTFQVVDHKLSTYPTTRSAGRRVAKFRSTGLFASFEPSQEEVAKVARQYDLIMLVAARSHLVPVMKQYNPSLKVLMYFDSGLTPQASLIDAGSVDEQNTEWLVTYHPEWLLKDGWGNPIKGESYWPDPGNQEWQAFFAEKLNRALELTGDVWDGVLLDQFLGFHNSHRDYAGTELQVNYGNDSEFQAAQLSFLQGVSSMVSVPIVPNVEGLSIVTTPSFFSQAVEVSGGAEAEVFVMEAASSAGYSPPENIKRYIEVALNAPKDKLILLNSPTAGIAGDVDWTLYAYFTYLLVAAPDRQVYWTFKEGISAIPHYWYREFDLDLGLPLEGVKVIGDLWNRAFENADVVVNPTVNWRSYAFRGIYYDVLGRRLRSPLKVAPHSGLLLVKKTSILQ